MKRRDFIKLHALLFTSSLLGNTQDPPWRYIEAILQHMFDPKIYGTISPALFLQTSINQKHFEIDTIEFLLDGVKKITNNHINFISFPPYKKEKILRNMEKDYIGKRWLNKLHLLAIEAIFSDPIYGGNTHQIMWKRVNHNPGIPRPTKRYIYGV